MNMNKKYKPGNLGKYPVSLFFDSVNIVDPDYRNTKNRYPVSRFPKQAQFKGNGYMKKHLDRENGI